MALTKIQGNAIADSAITSTKLSTINNFTVSGNLSVSGTTTSTGAMTASGGLTSTTVTATSNTIYTGNVSFQNFSFVNEGVFEKANIVSRGVGTVETVSLLDSAGIAYYTGNANANVTVNLVGPAGVQTGNISTFALIITNNASPKYVTTVQVEGTDTGVTTRWSGGTAPSSGNASNIDTYVFNVIKTGASTYTVIASQTQFGG